MKAGINIWRALRDITDVHPAWARVAALPAGRYLESDLPRPITRKLDVGTLTGTKEFDETQVGCGILFADAHVLNPSFIQVRLCNSMYTCLFIYLICDHLIQCVRLLHC